MLLYRETLKGFVILLALGSGRERSEHGDVVARETRKVGKDAVQLDGASDAYADLLLQLAPAHPHVLGERAPRVDHVHDGDEPEHHRQPQPQAGDVVEERAQDAPRRHPAPSRAFDRGRSRALLSAQDVAAGDPRTDVRGA